MRRKLFKVAAAVSLVLCLGTVVLWARSRQTIVVLGHYQWKQARWQVVLSRGRARANNQPQLDWQKNKRAVLEAELRDAEIRRAIALKTMEIRRVQLMMEYHNNLRRVEEVEQSDTETIRRGSEAVAAIRPRCSPFFPESGCGAAMPGGAPPLAACASPAGTT